MESMCSFWLARNKSGDLYRFEEEPFYEDGSDPVIDRPLDFWNSRKVRVRIGDVDKVMFPEITFENSPILVKLIKNK